MTKDRRSTAKGERGAALVLALLVILFVAVVGIAALGYSNASLRSSNIAIRPARNNLFTAEASTQAAIRYVRNNWFAAQDLGLGCSTYTYDPVNNVTTQICPSSGSFNSQQQPVASLLVLGSQGFGTGAQGTLSVTGNVWSGGPISTSGNSEIDVHQGQVFARGSCTGSVIKMDPGWPAPNCSYSGPAGSIGSDPNYLPVTTTLNPGSGSCNTVTNVATLTPGSFNQNQWNAVIGSCTTIWLSPDPGNTTSGAASAYYFDSVVMDVHQSRLVGGTLRSGVTAANLATATYPGLCQDTNTFPNALGVQLVFGGTSQISMGSQSTLEICGFNAAQRGGASNPRVVIYGIKVNTGGLPATTATYTPTTIQDTSTGTASWAPPNSLPSSGSAADPGVANLQFSGFGLASQSVVSSVTLSVSHVEDGNVKNNGVTATVGDAFGVGCTLHFSDTAGTYTNQTPAACTGLSLSGSSLYVKWSVVPKNNKTTSPAISGLTATITSSVPPLTQLLGTFMTTNGNAAQMHLVGTVYVPTVAVNLQVPNISQPAITDSLVVDHGSMVIATGSVAPAIGSGASGTLGTGDVILNTFIGSQPWISARVSVPAGIPNNTPGTPAPTVTSWVIRH